MKPPGTRGDFFDMAVTRVLHHSHHASLLWVDGNSVAAVADHKYVSIWGGDRTDIETYPFIASVQFKRAHMCTGVIVSDLFILTTASCFQACGRDVSEYSIVVGTSNLKKGGVAYNVARVIQQDEYPASLDHDIGLLKLVKPLNLSTKVAIASLAPEGLTLSDHTVFNVTGWGPDADSLEGTLKTTKVYSVDSDACSSRNGDEFRVTKYTICAGSNGHGPCMGDLAAPLTLKGTVVGITSRTKRCASLRYPTIYVRVSEFQKWIDHEIMMNVN